MTNSEEQNAVSLSGAEHPAQSGVAQKRENLTFAESVEEFLGVAHWLTPQDTPMITGLRRLAAQLDLNDSKAALYSQFQLYFKHVARRDRSGAPKKTKDPLEALLDGDNDE